MKHAIRLAVFLISFLLSLTGFAAAVIETANGEVKAGATVKAATAASAGQRVEAGTTVITGPKSLATLRFDDGQYMLLHENTEFRVAQYSFSKNEPAKDRFVFELLRGALRSVTTAITNRNPQAYLVRMPMATIGIRGTDYMAAVVNPGFFSVAIGTIQVANTAGAVTFTAGTTGFVAAANALAVAIPAASLPASVSAAFSQLSSIAVSAASAAGAAGAAAGGVTPAAVAVGAAVAAGVAAAVDDDSTTPATGTQ